MRSEGISGLKPKLGILWAGTENLASDGIAVRPDFLFVENSEPVIADAKYKYDWLEKIKNEYRYDVYQIVAYTRHKAVQKKLGRLLGKKEEEVKKILKKIYIFYPGKTDSKEHEENEKTQNEDENKIKSFDVEIIPVVITLPV